MTPKELYERQPELITRDLNLLRGCYYSHIPEISDEIVNWFDEETVDKNEKINIKIYKDFDFDGRRCWRLASVWFEGCPVMIIQNAGREGDDHHSRFITDEEMYKEMVDYIFSLLALPHTQTQDLVDASKDIKGLTEFYGNSLDESFERYYY